MSKRQDPRGTAQRLIRLATGKAGEKERYVAAMKAAELIAEHGLLEDAPEEEDALEGILDGEVMSAAKTVMDILTDPRLTEAAGRVVGALRGKKKTRRR